ncbi:hypothetical protein ACFLTA_00935 [Bacteroidota bacterium]
MSTKILERLLKDPGIKELIERLGEQISSSDLQSVLLEIARRRSLKVKPPDLLREFQENRFLKPSDLTQLDFNQLDRIVYDCLPDGFSPIELSPVAPFGSSSSVSNLNQNLAVSTVRHSEVVSDPTNVMAIEAAIRRKEFLESDPKSSTPIKLSTSHRLLRGQAFDNEKFTAHFRVFSLVTAGRDTGNLGFELEHLEEHIRYYLKLSRKLGIITGTEMSLSDFTGSINTGLFDPMLNKLKNEFSETSFGWDMQRQQAKNYYSPIAFRIRYYDGEQRGWDLVDGGFTDWTCKYLNNKKERFLGSAIGTELLLRVFPECNQK